MGNISSSPAPSRSSLTDSAGLTLRPEDQEMLRGVKKTSDAVKKTFQMIGISNEVFSKEMELKGKGAVKQVYDYNVKLEQMFITGEQSGIEAELLKKSKITEAAQNDPKKISHLDVNFARQTVLTEGGLTSLIRAVCKAVASIFCDKIPNFFLSTGYLTKAATTDLDRAIRKKDLTMHQRLDLAAQSFEAVGQLNALGFTHGDLKPDNFLIFTEGNKTVVKLSDFDKTKTTEEARKASFYEGNRRTRPPEGQNGPPGAADAWGATIHAIRIFEEAVLDLDGKELLSPAPDKSVELFTGKASKEKFESLRGFERAAALHKDFKARPAKGKNKYSFASVESRMTRTWEEQSEILDFTSRYIDTLTKKLVEKKHLTAEQAKKLNLILKQGTGTVGTIGTVAGDCDPVNSPKNRLPASVLAEKMSAFLRELPPPDSIDLMSTTLTR